MKSRIFVALVLSTALAVLGALYLPAASRLATAAPVNILNNCSSTQGSASDGCTDCGTPAGAQTDVCKESVGQNTNNNPVINLIKIAINIMSYVGGVAVIIILIISGLRMALAKGDAAKVATARQSIIYALVGVGIIVSAQVIVAFVLNKFK